MAANVKVIDISRTYVPIDPNSFPESMHSTGSEDAPEERVPSVPYDGYNFMPTAYGYMSYFGIASSLDINPILDPVGGALVRVDDLFLVQTLEFQNFLVALTERGIFTKYAGAAGAWVHAIDLPAPEVGKHLNWTKCVIENAIYCYRATGDSYYLLNETNGFIPEAKVPTQLNMAGQHGIFKAGGRLGFWDNENSTAWSDADDTNDFIPNLGTGAGAAIFQQVIGRIVNVIQHSNGFIIYATRSITVVQRGTDAFMFWIATSAFNDNGISYLQEATMGQPDTTHYAYTTFGLVKIEHGKAEYIIPEVFTYLKESRQPVYLKLLEGRYLFFQVLDTRYILPGVEFTHEVVPSTVLSFKTAEKAIDDGLAGISVCKGMRSAESSVEGAFLFGTYGYTTKGQASIPGQVPIWEDHISTLVPMAQFIAWKDYTPGFQGDSAFFLDGPWDTIGAIPMIDGNGFEFMLPNMGPPLIAGFAQNMHVEDNEQDFYMKQDFIWLYEDYYVNRDWKNAVRRKNHPPVTVNQAEITSVIGASGTRSTNAKVLFGPFVDPSFFSERNKVYSISDTRKSSWEQRSLTRGILVEVVNQISTRATLNFEYHWASDTVGYPVFTTYAECVGSGGVVGAVLDGLDPTQAPHPLQGVNETAGDFNPTGRSIGFTFGITGGGGTITIRYKPKDPTSGTPGLVGVAGLPAGLPVYNVQVLKVQQFPEPRFITTDIPTCVVKQLGYTKIKGHGHYSITGAFIIDDLNGEAADYTDMCLANPPKKKSSSFGGIQIPDSPGFVCGAREDSVVIDGSTFTFPPQEIILPPTGFFLQDGSIEPLYPTFPGAFVYDLQYKKWGKMSQFHKLLLNYSPLNTHAGDQIIPRDIFNVNAGCLLEDGKIVLFDKFPVDSIIKIGKIGYFRKGFTDCEEIIIQFRDLSTGTVIIEGSLDGKTIDPILSRASAFVNTREHRIGFTSSARWWNVCIDGIYDIKNVDFNGNKHGKR